MNNDRFLSTLGLARRASKLFYGYDSVCENAAKLYTVYLANDVSERTKKNLAYTLEELDIPIVTTNYQKNELGYAIGTKPVGIIGIADKGFAEILKDRIKEVIQ